MIEIELSDWVTFLCVAFAGRPVNWLGRTGIDAVTRIVAFFVSAIGVLWSSTRHWSAGAYGVKVVL